MAAQQTSQASGKRVFWPKKPGHERKNGGKKIYLGDIPKSALQGHGKIFGYFSSEAAKNKERLVLWYARTRGGREGPCGVRPRSRPRFGRARATEPDLFEIEYIVSNDGGQR